MDEQKNEASPESENQIKQAPPESPVKSRAKLLQETVDRKLAEREARQILTDQLLARRKQAAELKEANARRIAAAEAVTSAEQMAKTGPALAKGLHKAAEEVEAKTAEAAAAITSQDKAVAADDDDMNHAAFADLSLDEQFELGMKISNELLQEIRRDNIAKELRQIEMHNTMMDVLKEVTAQSGAICDLLSDIGGSMKDMATALCSIADKT